MALPMPPEESLRLHTDWWGKCRTCAFWTGDRVERGLATGSCSSPCSPLARQETTSEGYCSKWDTFDEGVAFDLLKAVEERFPRSSGRVWTTGGAA